MNNKATGPFPLLAVCAAGLVACRPVQQSSNFDSNLTNPSSQTHSISAGRPPSQYACDSSIGPGQSQARHRFPDPDSVGDAHQHGTDKDDRTRFSFCVSDTLAQPPRGDITVSLVREPSGNESTFIDRRLVLRPANQKDLKDFLQRTNGVVLAYDAPRPKPRPTSPDPPSGTYLVQIDPPPSLLGGFAASMEKLGLTGTYIFSSLEGAQLVALAAQELVSGEVIGLDKAFWPMGYSCATPPYFPGPVIERPAFPKIDYSDLPYTVPTCNAPQGSLGIGVVSAWDYLEYKGIHNGPFHRPIVAIVDSGFNIDSTTLTGDLDFDEGAPLVQLNEDTTPNSPRFYAGGPNKTGCQTLGDCPWHGTDVFSVAAAVPYNHFGSAGTASQFVKPYFLKSTALDGFEIQRGITDAVMIEPPADVINVSVGSDSGSCQEFCSYFYDTSFTDLRNAVNFARGNFAVITAAAGNNGQENVDEYDNLPCTFDGVVCVGAIDKYATRETFVGGAQSGVGPRVSIFAPDGIAVGPTPSSALDSFGGTSAASPFVAGIVALMKQLNPLLDFDQARALLQANALPGGDQYVVPGYVNAIGTVMAMAPNALPTIGLGLGYGYPVNGSQLLPVATVFSATMSDPEQPGFTDSRFFGQIDFTSDVQGDLCTATVAYSQVGSCTTVKLQNGVHTITATATDAFGQQASASITVTVADTPPQVFITHPLVDNSTYHASQQIELAGFADDMADGSLPAKALKWTYKVGGVTTAINCGSACKDFFTTLPVGDNLVTLSATNSSGQTGTATITIHVLPGSDFPSAFIDSPPDFFSFGNNEVADFSGHATDPSDPMCTMCSFTWTDRYEDDNKMIQTVTLGSGPVVNGVVLYGLNESVITTHTITLTVTNNSGNSGTAQITIEAGGVF
jgi:hypothetical protein